MNMRRFVFGAAVCALCMSVSTATAGTIEYNFLMDGLQEVPPVPTPATGECTVLLDDVSFAVTVNCTFEGLIGTANNAHIHGPAAPGVNAGIILGLTFTPATSGTITGNGILSATNAQHIIDGMTYINLHSTFRPGGEIRGQIVPEPASLALLGLGGLLVLRRRR